MDFTEPAEHAMLRDAVSKIVADFGHEYFARRVKEEGHTHELWEALGKAGFIGVNLPEECGGGGQGIAELAIVCEETAAGGCPLLLLLVSSAICGELLKRYGSPEQQQRWLPPLAAGTDRMVFAITEPDAGSNSHNISTQARRDGDGWRLSAETSTTSPASTRPSTMLVVARTGQDSEGRAQLSLFVVDTGSPGLRSPHIPCRSGNPGAAVPGLSSTTSTSTADRLIGGVGAGLRGTVHRAQPGADHRRRPLPTVSAVTRSPRLPDTRRERRVWSVPIGAHQGVAHPLATAAIELELARLMTSKAAWMHDAGPGRR